jgi:hypothetical protein
MQRHEVGRVSSQTKRGYFPQEPDGAWLEAAERADRLRDRFKAIHGVSIVRTVCAMTLAALAIIGVGLFWYFGIVPDSDGTL